MTALRQGWARPVREGFLDARRAVGTAQQPREAFEIKVDDGGGVERQPLRDQQSADDRHAERLTAFRTGPLAAGDRHVGRKRSRQAWWIASRGLLPSSRSA